MYEVDEKDRVLQLEGVPQSSIGAPLPLIISNEHLVILAYYMASTEPWDGGTIRVDKTITLAARL
jgi:hypothetical protein